jgi:transcriptional regulator GlxA family with amidase domain
MKRNVAIFIFPDVEVLDFCGPFEVFAVTDELNDRKLFHTYTVAEQPGPLLARNGLKVVPDHTFADCPKPDVLVVPGGFGTRPLLSRPDVINWIRARADTAEIAASVCTGSLLYAKAGVLDGQSATTHYLRHDLLRELAPGARVVEDRRFLDNGHVVTSAGISAGIDMSLHLVARLHGAGVAENTARYMEYHWRNDGGAAR